MGGAESDDEVAEDYKDIRVLAKDGGHKELLASALARISVR